MHLVLANRLGSLPSNSVGRLTDRLDMTIVVDWDVKPQIKQTKQNLTLCFRDAVICCAADGFTSLYGGFVIFSVIGYIAHDANMNITDVATSGNFVFGRVLSVFRSLV